MPTFDDTDLDALTPEPVDDTEPEYGSEVHALLEAAAGSKRIRTQLLGRRVGEQLDALKATVKRETKIAEAEAELSRLRRGED